MHLFVDISSHGLGHLAITAPVLQRLRQQHPKLRLTVRSGLSRKQLRHRLPLPFNHIATASDFGYRMHDALRIDRAASALAYQQAHTHWSKRITAEARFLEHLQPDLIFSNVSYLPLAGAALAGIPALALCSLNWADLFAHFYGEEAWAAPIHQEILSAYSRANTFLATTPGMTMSALPNLQRIGAIASLGEKRSLGLASGERAVLIAMGGIGLRLPIEDWPRQPGIRWLVPASWHCMHPDALPLESFDLSFTELLASVDAIITKPGYGTFCEAACNGTPVLYQRRKDWPEQACLIEWLMRHGQASELSEPQLASGEIYESLEQLWSLPKKNIPIPTGCTEAAKIISNLLVRTI